MQPHTAIIWPGLFFFRVVERADIAEHAHLRVLAHRAGVHNYHVRLELVLREAVAHLAEITAQLLAVGLVLLAAVGVYHCERGCPSAVTRSNICLADILLLVYPAYIYRFSFVRHC